MNDFKLTVTLPCPCCGEHLTLDFVHTGGAPPAWVFQRAEVPVPLVAYQEGFVGSAPVMGADDAEGGLGFSASRVEIGTAEGTRVELPDNGEL